MKGAWARRSYNDISPIVFALPIWKRLNKKFFWIAQTSSKFCPAGIGVAALSLKHTTTAGIKEMAADPLGAAIRDGKLFGRGACDTKSGAAAMMHTLIDLKQSGRIPECDIWVAITVDEEHAYAGVCRLCDRLSAAVVIFEPTEMRLVRASKGCL
jgi:acetylornithine deacetylase